MLFNSGEIMVQIHIDCDRSFYEKFKEKLKKKGEWRTISEFFRAEMRRLIEDESPPEKRERSRKERLRSTGTRTKTRRTQSEV